MYNLVVLVGPSGSGKTTIEKLLNGGTYVPVVSSTTRDAREGEINTVDYHFETRESFKAAIAKKAFIEHSEHLNNLYGTSKLALSAALSKGIPVQCIEINGAQALLQHCKKFNIKAHVFYLDAPYRILFWRLLRRTQFWNGLWSRLRDNAKAKASWYQTLSGDSALTGANLHYIETHKLTAQQTVGKINTLIGRDSDAD